MFQFSRSLLFPSAFSPPLPQAASLHSSLAINPPCHPMVRGCFTLVKLIFPCILYFNDWASVSLKELLIADPEMGEQFQCRQEHSHSEMNLLIGGNSSHQYSIFSAGNLQEAAQTSLNSAEEHFRGVLLTWFYSLTEHWAEGLPQARVLIQGLFLKRNTLS